MGVQLNGVGESHARSLISSGKVDKTSSWSMSADDENAILGKDQWTAYSSWHLGIDRAEPDKTKGRYKYPFGKGGQVYRSALIAIRSRASQQGATAIFDAAGRLIDQIDGPDKGKSDSLDAAEFKGARFEYKFTETEAPSTKGCFEGYGSVFNFKDDFGDVIAPGAFKETLTAHERAGTMPKMLLNHGGMGGFLSPPAPEDLLPIGKWTTLAEDSLGLQAKGRLINLDTESGRRVYGAMKENALDGLSIGYIPKDFVRGANANEPRRLLKQVHLFEISPVTFPANAAASISSVKSVGLFDARAAERALRDVGFSQAQARELLSRARSLGPRDVGGDEEIAAAMEAMRRREATW